MNWKDVREGLENVLQGTGRVVRGIDRLKRSTEPKLDTILALTAVNAGALYGAVNLVESTDFSDATNGMIMFGTGALVAGGNYFATRPAVKSLTRRINQAIDRVRPLSWLKSSLLATGITISVISLVPYAKQMYGDFENLKGKTQIEKTADEATAPELDVDVERVSSTMPLRQRPGVYDSLEHEERVELDFRGVRLADKNSYLGRVQRALRFEPIFTAIEKKYGMPRGTLAGMAMKESYADPTQPNGTNDGGFGITHIQGNVAKAYGLQIFGDSHRAHDPKHGSQIRGMLEDCGWNPACIEQYDERGHIIKVLDTAARIVTEGKRAHGSWEFGVEYYRGPGHVGKNVGWKYMHDARKFQEAYLSGELRAKAEADFNRRNAGRFTWDMYLELFQKSSRANWDLEEYLNWKN